MNKQTITLAMAGAIVGAVVIDSATPSAATPLSSSVTASRSSSVTDVIDVRYRRHYGRRYYNPGTAIGQGIFGPAAGAAIIGSGYYGPGYGYYGPDYGSYGYYGKPYPYPPIYYYPY
jgi:hypothetical protein